MAGRAVNRQVAGTPFCAEAAIPGGIYRGTDADVRSVGPRATW